MCKVKSLNVGSGMMPLEMKVGGPTGQDMTSFSFIGSIRPISTDHFCPFLRTSYNAGKPYMNIDTEIKNCTEV